MKFRIGTRDSKLALKQTEIVCKLLLEHNSQLTMNNFEIIPIKTQGDKILNKNLVDFGGKNLFVKELEDALNDSRVDFVVHSLKDMTGKLNDKFVIAACLEREDPRDAFVSVNYRNFEDLPEKAVLGTSSVRRKYLALAKRKDLNIIPFRGNVLTRLEKLKRNEADGTFLAMSGLNRLNISSDIYVPLSLQESLPAPCQGIIAVECKRDDNRIINLISPINDHNTQICSLAERGFLEELDADCSTPLAAYAFLDDDIIYLDALVINNIGIITRKKWQANKNLAKEIGREAARYLRAYL